MLDLLVVVALFGVSLFLALLTGALLAVLTQLFGAAEEVSIELFRAVSGASLLLYLAVWQRHAHELNEPGEHPVNDI